MQYPWSEIKNPLALPAGALRHLIQIQSQSTTPDDVGQPLETWTTILTQQAEIEALTERELFQSGQLVSQVSHRIRMRWVAVTVSAGMRAVHGSDVYKIQSSINVSQRNLIRTLLCLQIDDDA